MILKVESLNFTKNTITTNIDKCVLTTMQTNFFVYNYQSTYL